MQDISALSSTLRRIDGRGYKAYKDIQGGYAFKGGWLFIDHVQGDPFAAPSKARIRFSQDAARIPESLFRTSVRRVAMESHLARRVGKAIQSASTGGRGSGGSGRIHADPGGQEVLDRTAVVLNRDWVEARIEVGLPARGRSVLGIQAEELLCEDVIDIGRAALTGVDETAATRFVQCVENYHHIREQLDDRGLVAFVADGAILPRASGVSDKPMRSDEAVPFESPESLKVEFDLPNPANPYVGDEHRVSGMGIPHGVTIITGGGYHGKSTLLRALERGVYPHAPDDGREYVVANEHAVKVRAEDRRRIERVDISPFINQLSGGKGTTAFQTDEASGSTSQAANIVEASEAGAHALLIDEDTSATNFMVRDARMQALVASEDEPITPFVDRVRELYDNFGVSTVLVMGGSGDYLDVADTVIRLREYVPHDSTAEAQRVVEQHPTRRGQERAAPFNALTTRIPDSRSIDASRGKRDVRIRASDLDEISFGTHDVDVRSVEQLVDRSQSRAIGYAMHLAAARLMRGGRTLGQVLDDLDEVLDREGLDALDPFRRGEEHPGNFARPRRHEIAAALNRLRSLTVSQARE